MWSWNQFKNLPRNRDLSPAEQSRQYFIYQSNMMYEASINNTISVAAAAAAAAGSGGGGGLRKPSGWIDTALESLNSRYEEVTNLVPNLYCFWDDYTTNGDSGNPILTGINDGGDDMYDGGNYMNTNLTANWDDIKEGGSDDSGPLAQESITYTHTQADNEDDDPDQYYNPPMDGKVRLGDSYFGSGSKYFTNMYPGLFIMVADDISVSEFNISGNVGSDGDGVGAGYVDSIIPGWTLFYKTNTDNDNSDPSINQLILVPGTSDGITHEYDESSENDDHRVSGIDDRSRIIYAVVARHYDEDVLSENDAIKVATKILEVLGFTLDLLIFGLKSQPTSPPDDYILFDLLKDNQVTPFETSNYFYGPTVFANNTDDGLKYFTTKNIYDPTNPILFGKMDNSGSMSYIDIDIVANIGGAIDDLSFTSVAGVDNTYTGLTGSITGSGYAASFDIIVSGGTVSSVLLNTRGDLYKPNDTISINASNFGGTSSQSITITVDSVKGSSSPTSMYYLGENQFVCLDRLLFVDDINYSISPKTYIVDAYYGTASLLSVHNVDIDGLYPTSLFKYKGDVWGVLTADGLPISSVARYDVNTGVFDNESINQIVINNIPNITMSKVWFVMSAINVGDRIYCNLFANDKETNNSLQCIAELNVETGEADYLYSVPLDIQGGEYLYTNIIDKNK